MTLSPHYFKIYISVDSNTKQLFEINIRQKFKKIMSYEKYPIQYFIFNHWNEWKAVWRDFLKKIESFLIFLGRKYTASVYKK